MYLFFFLLNPRPPYSILFPYTTLFRSHFLYNTLNTIASLAEVDTAKMVKLLHEFGNYLQRSFDIRNTQSDRKSTRLNSSHVAISYAVFCLKKKKKTINQMSFYFMLVLQ